MIPLIVLLFGLIQYGLYFWAMQGGADVARSAARLSAVSDEDTRTCSAFRAEIQSQVDDLAAVGEAATILRSYDQQDPTEIKVGDTVKVEVRFKSVDLHFPFVPFIDDGLVTSTAEARVDFVDSDDQPEPCA